MADPAFPSSLPAPLLEGYGYKPVSPSVRTNMDSGTARMRRRFVNTPTPVTAKWRLRTAQLGIFESFWKNDLVMGSLWFTVRLPNGRGLNAVRARIMSTDAAYQVDETDSPEVFDLTLQLETFAFPIA